MLTLTPSAISCSIAGIPAGVAGTLIMMFGRQRCGHLEADEPVAPSRAVEDTAQQVRCRANVVEGEHLEERLRVDPRVRAEDVAQLVVVVAAARHRLQED